MRVWCLYACTFVHVCTQVCACVCCRVRPKYRPVQQASHTALRLALHCGQSTHSSQQLFESRPCCSATNIPTAAIILSYILQNWYRVYPTCNIFVINSIHATTKHSPIHIAFISRCVTTPMHCLYTATPGRYGHAAHTQSSTSGPGPEGRTLTRITAHQHASTLDKPPLPLPRSILRITAKAEPTVRCRAALAKPICMHTCTSNDSLPTHKPLHDKTQETHLHIFINGTKTIIHIGKAAGYGKWVRCCATRQQCAKDEHAYQATIKGRHWVSAHTRRPHRVAA